MSGDEREPPSGVAVALEDSLYFFDGTSWTPQIEDAAQTAALWINCDLCGASFWGLPRVGKSEFARYFEEVVEEMFGGTVVVVRFSFGGEQFRKPEQLLRRAIRNLDVPVGSTRDREALRIRLMQEVWSRCTLKTRRIVVIADELQNVTSDLYGEFAIMEAAITEKKYVPFLLCIGQPELQSTVVNVEKNLHTKGRLFQELREFRGLSFDEVVEFLTALDGDDLGFTKKHFPRRAVRGWSIVQLVPVLKKAVLAVHDLEKMGLELFFPMAYLRQTLNYLFFFLVDEANDGKEAIHQTVLEAFERNGFRKLILSYAKARQEPGPPEEAAA